MQLRNLFSAAVLAATTLAQAPISTVYQFANSFSGVGYVNIENVALRKSNGQLLLNFVTGAIMAQLDPANPVPEVLVNISSLYPGAPASLTGIDQIGDDVYAVNAGNFQFGPQVPGGVAGIAGSFSVWSVDLSATPAQASQIVAIPEAGLLNGLTAVNKDVVLLADSALGAIWRVDIKAGTYEQVLADPLFLPNPGVINFGINGIKYQKPYLYFTNSAQGTFGAIPFGPNGYPGGAAQPFVYAPNGTYFDDFALSGSGAYLATHPNAIYKAVEGSSDPILVAGGGADTTFAGAPTSCVFGADGETLYVVTGGLGGGPTGPVSGGVYAINVASSAAKKLVRRFFKA